VYLPANFLYHGLAAFTTDVITVEHTIRIRIVVVIGLRKTNKIFTVAL
jgi:hypothetical protein